VFIKALRTMGNSSKTAFLLIHQMKEHNRFFTGPRSSKGLLRHTSLATTQRHYIKDVPENTLQAMIQLEALFSQCSTTKH
jgi:hypothetical protein